LQDLRSIEPKGAQGLPQVVVGPDESPCRPVQAKRFFGVALAPADLLACEGYARSR
jgi:hypothetical protein